MKIAVRGIVPCDLTAVRRAMHAAARPYGLPSGTVVTLAFVGDDEMRALNRRYRRADRTTDVLSFGERVAFRDRGTAAARRLAADPDGVTRLGDVVISAARAARQARRRRKPLGAEIAFLAAHGVLHLLGFDDETAAGYREMVALGTAATRSTRPRPTKR
ncbi:MAG TPA: rRNA maturation RNase YbeY [Candidatus Limnocylindria bacterium]|nr:rRNA maturation RNase YbeY [Candidatus Limnocylindria bacterium]